MATFHGSRSQALTHDRSLLDELREDGRSERNRSYSLAPLAEFRGALPRVQSRRKRGGSTKFFSSFLSSLNGSPQAATDSKLKLDNSLASGNRPLSLGAVTALPLTRSLGPRSSTAPAVVFQPNRPKHPALRLPLRDISGRS